MIVMSGLENGEVAEDPDAVRQRLTCGLFGLDPAIEKRPAVEILDEFSKLGKDEQDGVLNRVATLRVQAAGIATAPPAAAGAGIITPGLARFDRFPRFSGEPDKHSDELPVELWCGQLKSYLLSVCGPEVGENWITCAVRQLTGNAAHIWAAEEARYRKKGFPVNLNVLIEKLKSAFGSGNRTLSVMSKLNTLTHTTAGGVIPFCNQFQILMAELGEDRTNLDYIQGFLAGLPRTVKMRCTQEFVNDPDATIGEYLEFTRKLADPTLDLGLTNETVSGRKAPTLQALGVEPAVTKPNKRGRRSRPRSKNGNETPAPPDGPFSRATLEQAQKILDAHARTQNHNSFGPNQGRGYGAWGPNQGRGYSAWGPNQGGGYNSFDSNQGSGNWGRGGFNGNRGRGRGWNFQHHKMHLAWRASPGSQH